MRRTVLSLIALAALFSTAARAAEGPGMTAARQLDLAAQHLAATAAQEVQAGRLDAAAGDTAVGFAALVRDFRFDLEADAYSVLGVEAAWAQVAEGFTSTRDLLHDSNSQALQHELLRVHTLMNRLDRGFGGSGFWSGPHGWSG